MDETEARRILDEELRSYESRSYKQLIEMVDRKLHVDRDSPSGTIYQIDVEVLWDDMKKGTIRVIGAIDDRGLPSVIIPLTQDFIMTPDGTAGR